MYSIDDIQNMMPQPHHCVLGHDLCGVLPLAMSGQISMHAFTCSSLSQVHLHAQPHQGHPHPGQGHSAYSALCLAAPHGIPYAPTPPVDQISFQWDSKNLCIVTL